MLVYDITKRETFEKIQEIYHDIEKIKPNLDEYFNCTLIGNKCDLIKHRKVWIDEAEDLAKQIGCPHLEISAYSAINTQYCQDPFCELAVRMREGRLRAPVKNKSWCCCTHLFGTC